MSRNQKDSRPIAEADISWIRSAVDKSPNAFFTAFNLDNKQHTHKRYQQMILDSDLDADVKEDLVQKFETWKTDHAQQFWLDQRTHSSQMRTAAVLVKGSEPYVHQSIHRNASRIRGDLVTDMNVLASSPLFSHSYATDGHAMKPDENSDLTESENPDRLTQAPTSLDSLNPAKAMVASSLSQASTAETVSSSDQASKDTESELVSVSVVDDVERAELLANIHQSCHIVCEWKIDGCCIACLFQEYQKICVEALVTKNIKKSEIADVMAITGIFAPFLPTARMIKSFKISMLEQLVEGTTFPDLLIDDAAVLTAVRLWINNERDEASEALRGLDRQLRNMFETLLEQMPMKQDRSISEATFATNYVAPILHATLKLDTRFSLHFPNTSSEVQKHQGLKPDRPDIVVKARDREVLYGEVTGLSQENSEWKNKWDLFRLARFGKSFLNDGYEVAPLLQVVYSNGTYMRLTVKARGIYLLQEVGSFMVPTTVSTIPALLATLPTLLAAQVDLKSCLGEPNDRKRSWGYKDIMDAKKRLI
ncbi:hypothetical protein BGZ49_001182 [Haplosporangium sp. Z 27]|nr:hypothetical protein BGZ49_001182 [Haplosporangium sp. Z 27]